VIRITRIELILDEPLVYLISIVKEISFHCQYSKSLRISY